MVEVLDAAFDAVTKEPDSLLAVDKVGLKGVPSPPLLLSEMNITQRLNSRFIIK